MRFSISSRVAAALLLLAIGSAPLASIAAQAAADAPEKSAAAEQRAMKLKFFRERIGEHRGFRAGRAEKPFALVEKPLLHFDNPVSGIADGFVFLWTDGGRPAALVKSYYNTPRGSWGRTFVSLAEGPIEMRHNDRPLWTPQQPGETIVALDDAAPPAADARTRLAQMRALARRFRVVDNWGLVDPTDWDLRLLPTPLFRYQAPDEQIVDGALFAYVLTSSPEALVLLEAQRDGEGLKWRCAVSRATRFGITFWLDDRKLAEFPRLDRWPATGAYFHQPSPMPDYPFQEAKTGK